MHGTNEKEKELLLPVSHNHKTWSDHSAAKIFRAELFPFLTVLLLQYRNNQNFSSCTVI